MAELSQSIQNEKDILCIKAVLSGNNNAFRDIVEFYENRLRSFCRTRLPDSELDDIMQEIFLKTYRNLKSFRAGANFASWFFTIAYNTIATKKLQFKKELNKNARMIAFSEIIPLVNEGQQNLELEMIRNIVRNLKDGSRSVVELYYFAELDIAQIGKILSISESSVKTRLFRARNDMRKYIEDCNR